MRRFKYVLLILVSFFLSHNMVFAGVCEGKATNESSGYCMLDKAYKYANKNDASTSFSNRYFNGKTFVKKTNEKTDTSRGYLGYSYDVISSSSVSGYTEYAFCLDPEFLDPEDFPYARELVINSGTVVSNFDMMVYKAYQYLVDSLAAVANNNTYDEAKKSALKYEYIAYTDVVLRTLVFSNNFNFNVNSISHSDPNIETLKKERANTYKNKIVPYIISDNVNNTNLATGSSNDEIDSFQEYWATIDGLKSAKKYYDNFKNFNLWVNPLKINTSETCDGEVCKFTFEVNFIDEVNKTVYFGNSVPAGYRNGDYSVNILGNNTSGNAFFNYKGVTINNDDKYFLSNVEGAKIYMNDSEISFSDTHAINLNTSNANKKRTYVIEVPRTFYDEVSKSEGDIHLNFKYETFHPMSSDNVFINYVNDRNSGAATLYQRMVVFTRYVANRSLRSDNYTPSFNFCNQEVDSTTGEVKFLYGTKELSIEEYKEKCSCVKIKPEEFEDNTDLTNQYNNMCKKIEEEEYTSTLYQCGYDADNSSGKNVVTHTKTQLIDNNNRFCTKTCKETIEVSDLVNEFTVYAGRYFEFDKYPKLSANKDCTVSVDYDEWKKEYEILRTQEIDAVNRLLFDYAVNNASWVKDGCCSCGSGENKDPCCDTYDRYKYTYKEYYYNRYTDTIEYSEYTRYYNTGCRKSKPDTNSYGVNEAAVITAINNIENHFDKLRDCNKHLNGYNDIYDFYDFEQELRYYYRQQYTDSSVGGNGNGWTYNNAKPNSEVDDSLLVTTYPDADPEETCESLSDRTTCKIVDSKYNYTNSKYINDTENYLYISDYTETSATSGYQPVGDKVSTTEYDISRDASYYFEYKPSVEKVTNVSSGVIISTSNPIEVIASPNKYLGYVYNIDLSAIERADNDQYYRFERLGDKNEIADYFNREQGTYKRNEQVLDTVSEALNRSCTYEIKNPILITCMPPEVCSKPNYFVRVVDSSNIDPNNRLGTDKGFKNWDNEKGKVVMETIEKTDTFNPNNLEYSFTLDSATIKKIRNYNNGYDESTNTYNLSDVVNYSSVKNSYSKITCNVDGNECTSVFIDELAKNNGAFGDNVATNISGRDKWKYMYYDTNTLKWSIKNYESEKISSSQYDNLTEQLGGITP